MTAIVTSRVIAEFYIGVEFPDQWLDDSTTIGVGMARDRVLSVTVFLDIDSQPLAACWQLEGHNEKFVRIRFDEGTESDLLEELNDDLQDESSRIGSKGLCATLLWEPTALRPEQGTRLERYVRIPAFGIKQDVWWNLPSQEILANASRLLLVARQVTNDLALAVPNDAEEMHGQPDAANAEIFLIFPTDPAALRPQAEQNTTRNILILIGALLVAAILLGVYISNLG